MRYAIIGAGWLWGCAAADQITDASVEFGWQLLLPAGWVLIGLAWCGYSCARRAVFRAPRVRWLWLSVPAVGAGCWLLDQSGLGLAARTRLCEPTLRDYAEAVRLDRGAPHPGRRVVGLFLVRSTAVDGDRVLLYTTSPSPLESAGLVFCPDGVPTDERARQYRHVHGPWWLFRESWPL
ncbi:hypothetical protein R5W23_002546 [Gemmata sp. JC673]|uniref:Uncharacterized protein n=1 Tax=Gemmata algarum TaxID=2975278 RepID=A0ABU5F1J4_9BACT|nr:hypothetical protein [Gemmata algarum]MDY3561271.1 hypothetical protein [Gemmata algarum]